MSNVDPLIALPYNNAQARSNFQQRFLDATDELEETANLWFSPGKTSRLGEGALATPWSSDDGCAIRVIEQLGSEVVTVRVLDQNAERRTLVHSVLTKHMAPPSRDELVLAASEPGETQAMFIAMLTALSDDRVDPRVEELFHKELHSDDSAVRAAAVTGLLAKGRGDYVPALRERRAVENDAEVQGLLDAAIMVCSGKAELLRSVDNGVIAKPLDVS